MRKKQKIGAIIGTALGVAAIATAVVVPVVLPVVLLNNKNNSNVLLNLDQNKSKIFYDVLENCIEPKEDVQPSDLNNETVFSKIKNNLNSQLNIKPSLIENIKFIQDISNQAKNKITQPPQPKYNVEITFKDNTSLEVIENDFITKKPNTSNTIITKHPINYDYIKISSQASNKLLSKINEYLTTNNNGLYEQITKGNSYDTFVQDLNNILNKEQGNNNIIDVKFNLSNNNTQVNVDLNFDGCVKFIEHQDNNFILGTENVSISTKNNINASIFTKIENSKVNLNENGFYTLFSYVLGEHPTNTYDQLVTWIQENNGENLISLLNWNTKIGTMNYKESIIDCLISKENSSNLKDASNSNTSDNYVIKLNNNKLGGNVYVEFDMLKPSGYFIFNDTCTTLTGLTENGKQAQILDLSQFIDLTIINNATFDGSQAITINLSNTNISSIDNIGLNNLTTLQTLDLSNCTNYKTIVPNSFTSSSLTTLNLSGTGISIISESIFNGLTSLQTLDLSNTLIDSIPTDTFNNLTKLQTINLSHCNNLTTLAQNSFRSSSITNVDLSYTKISSITKNIFNNCGRLENLNLEYCENLTSISGATNQFDVLPFSLLNINLKGCTNITWLNQAFAGTKIKILDISDCNKLTNIDQFIQSCSQLTEIKFPDSNLVETMWAAFYNCYLTSIDLSSFTNLITISSQSLEECPNLKSITFPKNLRTILNQNIWGDPKINIINFPNGSNLESIGQYNDNLNKCTIYVNNSDGKSYNNVKNACYKAGYTPNIIIKNDWSNSETTSSISKTSKFVPLINSFTSTTMTNNRKE